MLFERRCSGHCCKSFILPWLAPDQIEHKREFYKDDSEAQQVLNMVIYLGNDPNKFPESAKKVLSSNHFKHKEYSNTHYYTCKHHCNITGNCLIYDDRPKMCRTFPDQDTDWKGACGFSGCTKRYTLKQMFQYNFNRLKSVYEVRYKWRIKDYIYHNFTWCFSEIKMNNPCKEISNNFLPLRGLRSLNEVDTCIKDESYPEESVSDIQDQLEPAINGEI
jgi:Fe-S-cluster containining protein